MNDLTQLLREIATWPGWTVTRTRGGGHWQVRRHGRIVATTASTPSDIRGLRNLRAAVRRAAR